MTSSRDDFPESTKHALAARVNHRCSNPGCGARTSGPQVEPGKALNVGVAAHIASAAPGGPRYDPTMTPQQRADIANGVWLCQTCAKLVDNDEVRFKEVVLREWKAVAEQDALDQEAVQIIDKWVNESYPEEAGIIQELTAQGYDLRWSTANQESERVDLQGWEPVLLDQTEGTKARLKIHDQPVVGGYLILLKKKKL
ncbi:MAG: hypothetical protein E6J74_42440 [Deltaproteobacteria bacterium]|nr:MAG: hypothetical protein E6J74_42440 [Deltaproteobacteria bacterium]